MIIKGELEGNRRGIIMAYFKALGAGIAQWYSAGLRASADVYSTTMPLSFKNKISIKD
jgi:hypothetical protein